MEPRHPADEKTSTSQGVSNNSTKDTVVMEKPGFVRLSSSLLSLIHSFSVDFTCAYTLSVINKATYQVCGPQNLALLNNTKYFPKQMPPFFQPFFSLFYTLKRDKPLTPEEIVKWESKRDAELKAVGGKLKALMPRQWGSSEWDDLLILSLQMGERCLPAVKAILTHFQPLDRRGQPLNPRWPSTRYVPTWGKFAMKLKNPRNEHARTTSLFRDVELRRYGDVHPLQLAVHSGSFAAVDLLLEAKAECPLGYPDKYNGSQKLLPLEMAALSGNVEMTKKLLAGKTDAPSFYIFSDVVEAKHIEIVKLLLNSKTNPCFMSTAVKTGSLPMVQCLMDAKADLSDGSYNGLAEAFELGDTSVIDFLLEQKANPNLQGYSSRDTTPLTAAVKFRNLAYVEKLIEAKANVERDRYSLRMACRTNHSDMVGLLLQHNANQNVSYDYDSDNPLMIAAGLGALDIVKKLLEQEKIRTEIQSTQHSGIVPATMAENYEMLEVLFEAKASAKNDGFRYASESPWVIAAKLGSVKMVKFLKSKGLPFYENNSGLREACEACEEKSVPVVAELLEYGANQNDPPLESARPIVSAVKKPGPASLLILKMLLAKNPKQDSLPEAVYAACEAGNVPAVKELLALPPKDRTDLLCQNSSFYSRPSIVTAAVKSGSTEIVTMLLDKKADPNRHMGYRYDAESYPLGCAAKSNSVEMMQLLLEAKATLPSQDHRMWEGMTEELVKRVEMAKMLVSTGQSSRLFATTGKMPEIAGQRSSNNPFEPK